MLFAYRQQTTRLLNDVGIANYTIGDIDFYINTARGQIAGEAECIRALGALAVDTATNFYPFTAITFPLGPQNIGGILNVRMVTYQIPGTTGQVRSDPREWEFFNTFVLAAGPVPVRGPPAVWTQFAQGASGTLFFPILDQPYTLTLDTVCYPDNLAADTDFELIPRLFTDAVPYFAAYIAALGAQKEESAAGLLKLYQTFITRGRQFANPSVLPHQWEQATDPQMASRLGVTKAA